MFFWDLAKFVLVTGSLRAKKRQLIMHLIVESWILPCYVYILEDEIPQIWPDIMLSTLGLVSKVPCMSACQCLEDAWMQITTCPIRLLKFSRFVVVTAS